jgi:hypothetical protein
MDLSFCLTNTVAPLEIDMIVLMRHDHRPIFLLPRFNFAFGSFGGLEKDFRR